jgi:hypothetical protein
MLRRLSLQWLVTAAVRSFRSMGRNRYIYEINRHRLHRERPRDSRPEKRRAPDAPDSNTASLRTAEKARKAILSHKEFESS